MNLQQYATELFWSNYVAVISNSQLPPDIQRQCQNYIQQQGLEMVLFTFSKYFANKPFVEAEALALFAATIEYMVTMFASKHYGYANIPAYAKTLSWFPQWLDTVSNQRSSFVTPQPVVQTPMQAFLHPSASNMQSLAGSQGFIPSQQTATVGTEPSFSSLRPTPNPSIPQEQGMQKNLHTTQIPVINSDNYKIADNSNTQINAPLSKAQSAPTDVNFASKTDEMRTIFISDQRFAIIRPDEEEGKTNEMDLMQMTNVTAFVSAQTMPTLSTLLEYQYIPIPENLPEQVIEQIGDLNIADSLESAIELIKQVGLRPLTIWISQQLSLLALQALKYRYNITDQEGFPIVSSTEDCLNLLDHYGAREDVKSILLNRIHTLFNNIDIVTGKITVKESVLDKCDMLMLSKTKEILAFPWYSSYLFASNQLRIHNGTDNDWALKLFQTAFDKLPDTTLSVDTYDGNLMRYRVWRLGRKTASPNKFLVDLLN